LSEKLFLHRQVETPDITEKGMTTIDDLVGGFMVLVLGGWQ